MKRTLSILVLAVSLAVSQAAPYFPGAWFSTVQKPLKQAGGVEITFHADFSMELNIYLGGGYLETVDGVFVESEKFYTFTVIDSDGWTWTGKLNKFTGQLVGTYRSADKTIRGKFQASRQDDGN